MKKILVSLAIACITLCSYAQKNLPVGMRSEITEIEQNDDAYSLFQYKDRDGNLGYYLSLVHTDMTLEAIFGDDANMSVSRFDECCLYLGETADDAQAALASLLDLLDEEPGTVREYDARLTNGAEMLTGKATVECLVRKSLFGKRLEFRFDGRYHLNEVQLTKGNVKSLIAGLKFYRKLHPKG